MPAMGAVNTAAFSVFKGSAAFFAVGRFLVAALMPDHLFQVLIASY